LAHSDRIAVDRGVACGGRYWTRTSDFLGVNEAL
jgi:hypothetical protein